MERGVRAGGTRLGCAIFRLSTAAAAACVTPYLFHARQRRQPLQQIIVLDAGAHVPVHAVQRGSNAGRRNRAGREHVEIVLCEKKTRVELLVAVRRRSVGMSPRPPPQGL